MTAYAAPPPHLPQKANGYEQSFSPAYDYDNDGCYAVPAIGALNGNCHDRSDLDNSQTYSRSKCNNGWCAVVYASYFEKDQAVAGSGTNGHRHDWEHVISWINQSTNRVEYLSVTKHAGTATFPRAQIRFENTHPKVVYHKDGGFTHFFRPALAYVADFGEATIKITDKGDSFRYLLNAAKPSGIPFNPYA